MIAPRDFITELKPGPGRLIGFFAVSLLLMFIAIVQVKDGKWLAGMILLAPGGIGSVVCLTALTSKRMILRLTPEGFAFGTLRKKYFYSWSDVAVFGVASIGEKRACFTLRPDFAGDEKVRAINQAAIGFDRFLPDTYGKEPMELAKLLEEWRYRYSDTKPTRIP